MAPIIPSVLVKPSEPLSEKQIPQLPTEVFRHIVKLDFTFPFELKIISGARIQSATLYKLAPDVNISLLLASKDAKEEALTTFFRDNRFIVTIDSYQIRINRQLEDSGFGATTYHSAQQKLMGRVRDATGALGGPYAVHIKTLVLVTDSLDLSALSWLCVGGGLARLRSAFINLKTVVVRMEQVGEWNKKMAPLFPAELGEMRPEKDEKDKPIKYDPRLEYVVHMIKRKLYVANIRAFTVPGMVEIRSAGTPGGAPGRDPVHQLWRETAGILAGWNPHGVEELKEWEGVSVEDGKTLRRQLRRMFDGRSWRAESD